MYDIYLHPCIRSQDLERLPPSLIEAFNKVYYPDLEKTPYPGTSKVKKHRLPDKPLDGYYAIEIDWKEEFEGDIFKLCYRIVYSIDSTNKRVYVISYGDHNPAYDSAKQRTQGGKLYRH